MKKMPKSLRKYIRGEKARIRRDFFGFKKQKELIDELYKKFLKQPVVEKTEKIKKTVPL